MLPATLLALILAHYACLALQAQAGGAEEVVIMQEKHHKGVSMKNVFGNIICL